MTGGPRLHTETYVSARGGGHIAVTCTCPIGHDHTYADWREGRDPRSAEKPRGGEWRPTPEARALLTPRELIVLAGVLDDFSILQMADRFDVSINTVKSQLGSIYRKLGVHNRAEAIAETLHRELFVKQKGAPSECGASA